MTVEENYKKLSGDETQAQALRVFGGMVTITGVSSMVDTTFRPSGPILFLGGAATMATPEISYLVSVYGAWQIFYKKNLDLIDEAQVGVGPEIDEMASHYKISPERMAAIVNNIDSTNALCQYGLKDGAEFNTFSFRNSKTRSPQYGKVSVKKIVICIFFSVFVLLDFAQALVPAPCILKKSILSEWF